MLVLKHLKIEQVGRKWDSFGELKVATVSKRGAGVDSHLDLVFYSVLYQRSTDVLIELLAGLSVYIFSIVGSGPPAPNALSVWEERL